MSRSALAGCKLSIVRVEKIVVGRSETSLKMASASDEVKVAKTLPKAWKYNVPPWDIHNWQPQVPGGPVHDGWAGARWPFGASMGKRSLYFKLLLFVLPPFWIPFFALEYHTKKANQS